MGNGWVRFQLHIPRRCLSSHKAVGWFMTFHGLFICGIDKRGFLSSFIINYPLYWCRSIVLPSLSIHIAVFARPRLSFDLFPTFFCFLFLIIMLLSCSPPTYIKTKVQWVYDVTNKSAKLYSCKDLRRQSNSHARSKRFHCIYHQDQLSLTVSVASNAKDHEGVTMSLFIGSSEETRNPRGSQTSKNGRALRTVNSNTHDRI